MHCLMSGKTVGEVLGQLGHRAAARRAEGLRARPNSPGAARAGLVRLMRERVRQFHDLGPGPGRDPDLSRRSRATRNAGSVSATLQKLLFNRQQTYDHAAEGSPPSRLRDTRPDSVLRCRAFCRSADGSDDVSQISAQPSAARANGSTDTMSSQR